MGFLSKHGLRLFVIVTLLVAAVLRPPGTMVAVEGETLTYILCSGDALTTVTVSLEGEGHDEADTGCDFFAREVADLVPPATLAPRPTAFERVAVPAESDATWHPVQHRFKARAPPRMS